METKKVNLEDLTAEQKSELLKQLENEKRIKRQKQQENKDTLKTLQDEFVVRFWEKLTGIAERLTLAKTELFNNAETIIDLKKQVYNMSDEALEKQQSHSISTLNCDKTIIIGHNTVDGWDQDLATSGINKVNEWLTKQLKTSNKDLVEMIRDLLKPNKEGFLKANRVMELSNRANKIGDAELIEAVSEIQLAYQPRKTTTFVKAKYRNDEGRDVWLNLSMSNA